jgi:hypothetical protein
MMESVLEEIAGLLLGVLGNVLSFNAFKRVVDRSEHPLVWGLLMMALLVYKKKTGKKIHEKFGRQLMKACGSDVLALIRELYPRIDRTRKMKISRGDEFVERMLTMMDEGLIEGGSYADLAAALDTAFDTGYARRTMHNKLLDKVKK